MIDTRFSTALQIVIIIAVNDEREVRSTSQTLAVGLDTNPSFVRKLVAPLTESGILKPSTGNNGGIRLARPPGAIKLSEIYACVNQDKRLWAVRDDIPNECFVSCHIGTFSEKLCENAENAVLECLAAKTVEDSIIELRRLEQGPVADRG